MPIQYLPVSWKNYHSLAQKLAATILTSKTKPEQIVAISRGGLTLGHMLSDFLRIPIATISIQSYTDIQIQGKVQITSKLTTPIAGKRVLLVDDVADSGKTLKRALAYLKRLRPSNISLVTLFYKPHSAMKPDYFAKETSAWIIFPYESTEMVLLLTEKLTNEGKSKAEIQSFLKSLHFTEEQILFVRDYHLK